MFFVLFCLIMSDGFLFSNSCFENIAPQMMSMLGNSYPTSGGTLSQSQVQGGNNPLSSMGMLNDVNQSEISPFDINDFPQLTGRPSSAGGSQGQSGSLLQQPWVFYGLLDASWCHCTVPDFLIRWFIVSLRKQGLGVNSIVQPNQEFSIHNEDFPALPGFKGTFIYDFSFAVDGLLSELPIFCQDSCSQILLPGELSIWFHSLTGYC